MEARMLLSVTGGEFLVNSTLTKPQYAPVVATSASGRSVVAWAVDKGTSAADIRAQIFDANGKKVGGEIAVTFTNERESQPAVSMDAKGNFIVVWTYDFLPGDKDVRAQRFDLNGKPVGSMFRVAYTPKTEFAPSVAMAANGSFVVSYSYQFSSSDTDILARRYDANANLVQSITVSNSSRSEYDSQAAITPDGRFGIAYGFNNDIYLKRYTATGAFRGVTTVAGTSAIETAPSLDVDNNGTFAVGWQAQVGTNNNIHARRVFDNGTNGTLINIATTSSSETNPSISIDPTSGRYVVAYQVGTGTAAQTVVKEVSSTSQIQYTTTIGTNLNSPAIGITGLHKYLVVAQSSGKRSTDPDGGIFGRLGTI